MHSSEHRQSTGGSCPISRWTWSSVQQRKSSSGKRSQGPAITGSTSLHPVPGSHSSPRKDRASRRSIRAGSDETYRLEVPIDELRLEPADRIHHRNLDGLTVPRGERRRPGSPAHVPDHDLVRGSRCAVGRDKNAARSAVDAGRIKDMSPQRAAVDNAQPEWVRSFDGWLTA